MIVSKKAIRRCLMLICVGRICDECPIEDECFGVYGEDSNPTDDDSTIGDALALFDKIAKKENGK